MTLSLRIARPEDAAACARLDALVWGADDAATEDRLLARILAHPFGNLVAVSAGSIVGSVWTVSSRPRPIATWHQAIGGQGHETSMSPFGELRVGVNIAVHPAWLDRGLSARLIERIAALGFAAGQRTLAFFPPIASYARWQGCFDADDYVRLMRHGERLYFEDEQQRVHAIDLIRLRADTSGVDPRHWPEHGPIPAGATHFDSALEHVASACAGGQRGRVVGPVPGYFKHAGSCDVAARVEWTNPEPI